MIYLKGVQQHHYSNRFIISLWETIWAYYNQFLLKYSERSCICVLGVSIIHLSTIFQLDIGTGSTV